MIKIFIFIFAFTSVFCQEASVVETRDNFGNENETITIDLKKKNEDIKLIAQIRIHIIEGVVHLNNNPLQHNIVNHVFMNLLITEIENGVQTESALKPTHLRVLVVENAGANGGKTFVVEEEFVQIDEYEVIQVQVQQIIFESNIRKSIIVVTLEQSEIHSRPVENDKRVMFADDQLKPRVSDDSHFGDDHEHGCDKKFDDQEADLSSEQEHHGHNHTHHHRRHHHHRHHHSKVKCWYRHLSWKSKIALFSVGFLSLIAFVLFCSICAKKRQAKKAARFEVNAPMDDTVIVDMDDVKKVEKKDENLDFHFEFEDSPVVVNDKQPLIQ